MPQSGTFLKSSGTVTTVYAASPAFDTRSAGAPDVNGTTDGRTTGIAESTAFASRAMRALSAAVSPPGRL